METPIQEAPTPSPSTPAIEEDESEDEHVELGTVMGSMKYAYEANSEYEISVEGELSFSLTDQ